ncbi:MAG: 30S ribosomal protein S2 [Candidatus Nomurabacteria bacterium]|jgi:small subunit ribosomal protein S2|nr:30S ribosomal protein S2 [Candidatus Nomurabacteria bacterium]
MSGVDIKALFGSGAHFGHKVSRWNPKMAKYIHSKRQDSHVLDLEQTAAGIEAAQEFLTGVAEAGRQVLFVGTKKQAKELVRKVADELGQPYVVERWLGGMLTNHTTIGTQIKKLKQLEKRMATGELANRYNKLEVQRFQEQIDADNIKYGGIKDMKGRPGAVIVVDVLTDGIAVSEAKKLGIPVVAIVDSNADPEGIDYVIPANDDAIKSLELILGYLADAVKTGAAKVKKEDKQ